MSEHIRHCSASPDPVLCCLQRAVTIAVVGFSANPERPSHYVAAYLADQGYKVIPVNPGLAGQVWRGQKIVADLAAAFAEGPVDIVDVFRQPDAVPAITEAAIACGAGCLWLQSGIVHAAAAEAASAAGMLVVMDACLMVEHRLRAAQIRNNRSHV